MDASTLLSVASGSLVGFILGLIGSGGSILALPLLVYVVGFEGDPHTAIGTTALAVAGSAFANLVQHHRNGGVRLRTGLLFAAPGVVGALLGAQLGLATDGGVLLLLFAFVLLAAAWYMLRGPPAPRADPAHPPQSALVMVAGALVGVASGFFGIGGGFLIVPALILAARLDTKAAIGTSLVAVTAFGLATATRYGLAGEIDLRVAGLFLAGGLAGGVAGTLLHHRTDPAGLRRVFAAGLVLVAGYMLQRNLPASVSW